MTLKAPVYSTQKVTLQVFMLALAGSVPPATIPPSEVGFQSQVLCPRECQFKLSHYVRQPHQPLYRNKEMILRSIFQNTFLIKMILYGHYKQ